MVSFIAIGGSGNGKSFIGNFFLTGRHDGPFVTFSGVDACTTQATTETNSDGRSYTDTPGIPDTNPSNTKAYYNKCIDAMKKEHSAILFVFMYGKKDYEKFGTSKLLFREMNKANCMKFLIINDHSTYGPYKKQPHANEYKELAENIKTITEVCFNLSFVVTPETMNDNLAVMEGFVKLNQTPLQVSSPNLRNFDELGDWVNSLKQEKFRLLAAKQECEDGLAREKKVREAIVFWNGVRSFGAGVIDGFIMTVSHGASLAVARLPVVRATLSGNEKKLDASDRRVKSVMMSLDITDEMIRNASNELKEEAEHYEELKRAVWLEAQKKSLG